MVFIFDRHDSVGICTRGDCVQNGSLKCTMLIFRVVTPCGPVLKMEAACSSETTVSICKSTQRYNSEDQRRHRRENLKYQTIKGDQVLEQI
jgi:hypothetical protein